MGGFLERVLLALLLACTLLFFIALLKSGWPIADNGEGKWRTRAGHRIVN